MIREMNVPDGAVKPFLETSWTATRTCSNAALKSTCERNGAAATSARTERMSGRGVCILTVFALRGLRFTTKRASPGSFLGIANIAHAESKAAGLHRPL